MKRCMLLLLALAVAAAPSYAFEFNALFDAYDGFWLFGSGRFGINEKKDRLAYPSAYNYFFADAYRAELGVDSYIPRLRNIPLTMRLTLGWIISSENREYPGIKLSGTEETVYYPVKESGVDIAIGLSWHFLESKWITLFFAGEGKYASMSYSLTMDRSKRTRVGGFGGRLSAGTYVRVWYPLYVTLSAGLDVQTYNSGVTLSYDETGAPVNLSEYPKTEFAYFSAREYFFTVGIACKFPLQEE